MELALRTLHCERTARAGGDLVSALRCAPDRPAHKLLSGESRPTSRTEDPLKSFGCCLFLSLWLWLCLCVCVCAVVSLFVAVFVTV